MLLVFVLSRLAPVPSVVEGAAVGCACKTVCMACLCVYPTCIVFVANGLSVAQCPTYFLVLSCLQLTSFGTPVFSSCSKQVRDVS